MNSIFINGREIGGNHPPYIIAELSGNHNGSLDRAKHSLLAAKECGVDAVKIQSYTPDTMTIECDREDFIIKGGLWGGYSLYDLYDEAHTPFEWHSELFGYAAEIGIPLFSTPFDESAADLLEGLGAPAYKIASFELIDLPLISYVAKKRKPMLMSTGMATEQEISEALEVARSSGCNEILLFHCVSSYPAPLEQSNLRQILNLKKKFGVAVGLSDHTMGNIAAITAVALGACAIEKHFTLSREDKGPDSEFSLEPPELGNLVIDAKAAWSAIGREGFIRPTAEFNSQVFRRSLYFVKDIKAGHVIGINDIRRIRPGFGLPPKYFDQIIGMKALRDINRGEAVTWNVIDKGHLNN